MAELGFTISFLVTSLPCRITNLNAWEQRLDEIPFIICSEFLFLIIVDVIF